MPARLRNGVALVVSLLLVTQKERNVNSIAICNVIVTNKSLSDFFFFASYYICLITRLPKEIGNKYNNFRDAFSVSTGIFITLNN